MATNCMIYCDQSKKGLFPGDIRSQKANFITVISHDWTSSVTSSWGKQQPSEIRSFLILQIIPAITPWIRG